MRVKRGKVKNRKHKEVLKSTKGYYGSYSRTYRRAREAAMHAGQYSYAHRKHRAAQMRRQWVKIISAGLFGTGVSYSKFINGLKKNEIELDRKVLAELAQVKPDHFQQIVDAATK